MELIPAAYADSRIPKPRGDAKQERFRNLLASHSFLSDYDATDRTLAHLCHSGEIPICIKHRFYIFRRYKLLMRPNAVY